MQSCLDTINDKLNDAACAVTQRYGAFIDDPKDPETNHKLRVSIRTLRSLIDFVGPWQKEKQNKRIQKNLKLVVRRTSRLRELDVLCDMVVEKGASKKLKKFCAKKAAHERRAVLKALTSKKFSGMLLDALDEVDSLRWKKDVSKHGLSTEALREHYDELVCSLKTDLADLDENDYEKVHDIRKRAKQVRYVSEQFGDILGDDAVAEAKRMKDEQDRLGAICDAKVNREIVQAFIEQEGLSPALADELRALVA